MYQKYYTNNTSMAYDIMVLSLYGKGIYVLPRQSICTEYCVPFNSAHAINYFKYHGIVIDNLSGLNTAVKITDANKKIAKSLSSIFADLKSQDVNHTMFKARYSGRVDFTNMLMRYGL